MKMPYEKPMMAIERYELTQSIATCELKIGFWDSQCIIKDPDAPLDLKDVAFEGYFVQDACGMYLSPEQENSLCYHTSVTMAFNS